MQNCPKKFKRPYVQCQPFPFQGPPKFTQIGIVGLKRYHLATLVSAGVFPGKRLSPNYGQNVIKTAGQ
jgi:hypothetical protein